VLRPSVPEFISVLLDQLQRLGQVPGLEPVVPFDSDRWLKPELRFTLSVLHVYVRTRLFAREEVEAIAAEPKNSRTHRTQHSASSLPAPASTEPCLRVGSVSGPVLAELGRLLLVNEAIEYDHMRFEVANVEHHRVGKAPVSFFRSLKDFTFDK
jgi:hypothetical protein